MRTYLHGRCRGRLDTCSPGRIGWQLEAFGRGRGVFCSRRLLPASRETLAGFRGCHLVCWLAPAPCAAWDVVPRTRRLFSGRRLPLEMLSSMGFHISSLSASLLPGRSWPPARVGKWDVRRALDMAEVRWNGLRYIGIWRAGGAVWVQFLAPQLMRDRPETCSATCSNRSGGCGQWLFVWRPMSSVGAFVCGSPAKAELQKLPDNYYCCSSATATPRLPRSVSP